jgi:hypothetical protein
MAKRSVTPAKGWRKGMTSSREPDSANVLMRVPVPLGPGAMGAPMPGESEDNRRMENSRGTTTRLRDTVKMMQRGRV